ncbi:MAG: GNAT family N-acetyltransferase [Gammaproteobacteria bacterium]|nr:MAG: GNAT family N-acetyltransferase [Gammaproteobacteria bacterium]
MASRGAAAARGLSGALGRRSASARAAGAHASRGHEAAEPHAPVEPHAPAEPHAPLEPGVLDVILRPLESASDFELAAAWLQLKENSQWLDFGANRQGVTPALLKIMVQRQTNFIRVYTSYEDDAPLGIVALNNVDRNMRTGTLWGVAGDKSFRCRGSTQVAASRLLTMAFQELGLHSVNTWTVEHNASRRAVERLGFRFIGRQRQCHFIDGQPYDRLLFDLLASEHRELDPAGFAALRARANAARATAQLPAHATP